MDKQGKYGSNTGLPITASPFRKLNKREKKRRWRWNHRVDAFTGQHPDYMPLPSRYLAERDAYEVTSTK